MPLDLHGSDRRHEKGRVAARSGAFPTCTASPDRDSINLRTEVAMHHHDHISRAVSTDREITLEALRVFTYLSRRLHFDRSVPVLQSELADALGMQRPNVNRAIKLLENKQILLRESKLGRAITFRLNPEIGVSRAA
ncbi:MarR family transcriptional regulator [Azospirillum sp. ST 5-10]|uniref:MarR family transcriptional regulator n=1 Tax=unclassified Azospirillum TaxID=2630922 RepID=UPI003F4A064E